MFNKKTIVYISFPCSSIPIRTPVRNISYGGYFNTHFPSEVVVYIAK